MLLKRLELNGFKSFASRTVLDFPSGVTAVVGPNGSGKSNVIDAIRWLLGEREAKHLRGGTVADLIFGGGEKRGRAGVATATLVFNNQSRFFPLEFDEVEIRREVDRSGTSAYFINKTEARLKDVVELLSQSRLGTKGVIVVSQGNSDLFIKANPEERREMIEEILGLREFRLKKSEAERRLKNTHFNLEKVRALIQELWPHLKMLRRQTSKWERRAEAEAELKQWEDHYFTARAQKLTQEYLALDPELDELARRQKIIERELKELQEELGKLERAEPEDQERLKAVRKEREVVRREREQAERELVKIEVALAVAEQRQKEGGDDLVAARELLREIYQEARRLIKSGWNQERIKELFTRIVEQGERIFSGKSGGEQAGREIKKDQERVRDQIQKLSIQLNKLGAEEAELEKKLYKFTEEFRHTFARLERKKAEISNLRETGREYQLNKERRGLKLEELKEQVRQAGRQWGEFIGGKTREMTEAEAAEAERQIFRLRGVLAAMGEVDQALMKEARETEERYEFLSSQVADLEKAGADLEEVILELARKIHDEFNEALKKISAEFEKFFKIMFGGGRARLTRQKPVVKGVVGGGVAGLESRELLSQKSEAETVEEVEEEVREAAGKYKDLELGVEVELSLPNKKVSGLEMLSGGERSLVSIAALFALVSVSPPPFLVLDEVDAPLDESNAGRFARMIKDFAKQVQFVVVTHNRATMEAADVLYGVTMGEDGASKLVSLKMTE